MRDAVSVELGVSAWLGLRDPERDGLHVLEGVDVGEGVAVGVADVFCDGVSVLEGEGV